jgi:ABC-type multidrug transport system ATPase subunit
MSLSINHIVKGFPSKAGRKPVLEGVSFEVPRGSVACLVGLNGSGKTTLLKTIATLLTPESGTVSWDGLDVHRRDREAKRRMGFASTEDHSFYGRLSAWMNLWFYAQLFGLSREAFRARIAVLTKDLDLEGILGKSFRELSNGQKQRMLLARATLHDPELILLDEPHQNLDPTASLHLRALLRETWPARGKTLLISTHHLDEALRISDRWVVLHQGKVAFNGSVAEARRDNPGWTVESFFQELTGAL